MLSWIKYSNQDRNIFILNIIISKDRKNIFDDHVSNLKSLDHIDITIRSCIEDHFSEELNFSNYNDFLILNQEPNRTMERETSNINFQIRHQKRVRRRNTDIPLRRLSFKDY